jgi:hypothetical protein
MLKVFVLLFRAMNAHQCGRAIVALELLEEARPAVAEVMSDVPDGNSVHDRLACQLFLNEAEALIEGGRSVPEPAESGDEPAVEKE